MEKSRKEKFGVIIAFRGLGERMTPSHVIDVDVMLGRQSDKRTGEIFYPSETVEQYLESKNIELPRKIGEASLEIDKKQRHLEWFNFNPGFDKTGLERKGLATVVDTAIIARLLKEYPGYTISHFIPNSLRRQMLKDQGMDPLRGYTIEEYYCRKRNHAREMFKKFPPRRK